MSKNCEEKPKCSKVMGKKEKKFHKRDMDNVLVDISCMRKRLDNTEKYNRVLAEQGHLDDEGYSR